MFASHERSKGRKALGAILGTLTLMGTVAIAYGSQRSFRHHGMNSVNPGVPQFDAMIQKIAESAVREAVYDRSAKAGFVIVADPNTGRILAVADHRKESRGDTSEPWALSYLVEPASAIKTIIAASAVEKTVAGIDESFDCGNGNYQLGNHVYHDHAPFDHLTAADTIVKSSNICGIRIGERLGPAGLAQTSADFGFGPGGVTEGFPGALAGKYPAPDQMDPNEYIPLIGTGYTTASGFYVNPLEIVQAYSVIANGGTLMKPISANAPDSSIVPIRQVLSSDNAKQWRQVLVRAVGEGGTGRNAESNFYTTGGKTSTAYHPDQDSHEQMGGEKAVGGFVGFAPAGQPKVVIYAAIIDPFGRTEGNRVAAPLFRDVAEKVLKYMKVSPDKGL